MIGVTYDSQDDLLDVALDRAGVVGVTPGSRQGQIEDPDGHPIDLFEPARQRG